MMMNQITASDALLSLRPNAEWTNRDDVIEWHSTDIPQPTDSEIQAEIIRLQELYASQEYARARAIDYPPMTDYLDGVVKGDQAQIDKYIADCQAVKTRYPKP
jgi:type II secretory pathway component PulK